MSRYRDPQLQVAEKDSYLFNLSTNICKSWSLDTHFIPNNSDRLIKQIKNDNNRDPQDKWVNKNIYHHLIINKGEL